MLLAEMKMGTHDRASTSRQRSASRSYSRSRLTDGALLGILSVCALAGYEQGCSSSTPTAPSNDAGLPPPSSNDSGGPDATLPEHDAALPDAAVDATPPADQSTPDAPIAQDAPSANVDCTSDDGGGGLENDLQCTGLYSDWASKTVASGIAPYTPGYVLWSDNANKARYLYLPPGTKIDTTDMDNWVFPVGTKVWKEFSLGPLRIETRLFVKVAAGTGQNSWVWTTYRWTADGESGATRLDTGEVGVNGTSYEIPAHGQCLQCHGGRTDMMLGLEAITLGTTAASGLSLATLTSQNAFTTNPPASIEIPEDSSGHARASLGWLHINCGAACHNSNPNALASGTGLFLKTSATQIIAGAGTTTVPQLAPYTTAVNVVPNMQPFASEGFFRINPGHPETSLVPTLDSARNNPNIPQMPPIISHIVDTKDVTALTTWIQTMPIPDAGAGPVDAGATD
jgi:hypothetical protein